MIKYYRDGNNVVCYDEDKKEIVRTIPIYEADGKTYTNDFIEVCKEMSSKKTETVETEVVESNGDMTNEENKDDEVEIIPSESTEIVPVQKGEIIESPNYKIVSETKGNEKLRGKGKYLLAGATIAAIIAACLFFGKKNDSDSGIIPPAPSVTVSPTTTPAPTLDDLKSDSRYVEISEEDLVNTTQTLIQEFAKNGIEINGEDALTFVTIANMTHLEKTNPELLNDVLGDFPDAETTLSKVGHIIGQVVTLEVTDADKQVDWTIALIDETDKKIAQHGMENVIAAAKVIAANTELSEKDKATEIQKLVQANYVKPNYDKTVGYDFTDGTHTSLVQEDGADFITDAIITGTLMGDNVLKNYIYGSETHDDLKAISYNEDNVSNLMRMIEECQNVEVQEKTNTFKN